MRQEEEGEIDGEQTMNGQLIPIEQTGETSGQKGKGDEKENISPMKQLPRMDMFQQAYHPSFQQAGKTSGQKGKGSDKENISWMKQLPRMDMFQQAYHPSFEQAYHPSYWIGQVKEVFAYR